MEQIVYIAAEAILHEMCLHNITRYKSVISLQDQTRLIY